MTNVIQLVRVSDEDRVGSDQLADSMCGDHRAVIQLVRKFLPDFEQLGRVAFEVRPFATRGGEQSRAVAMLNEDQCYLLLAYSRNTPRVRQLKIELVKAFSDARQRGYTESLTAWAELQRLCAEDAGSKVRASFGSRLMIDRKRALPDLRERRAKLESRVMPQLQLSGGAA